MESLPKNASNGVFSPKTLHVCPQKRERHDLSSVIRQRMHACIAKKKTVCKFTSLACFEIEKTKTTVDVLISPAPCRAIATNVLRTYIMYAYAVICLRPSPTLLLLILASPTHSFIVEFKTERHHSPPLRTSGSLYGRYYKIQMMADLV